MMPYKYHLMLILFLIALAVGGFALLDLRRHIKKLHLNTLTPYFRYLLSYNLIAVIFLIQTYFELNFLKRPGSGETHLVIDAVFRMLLYIPISLIPLYYFPHAIMSFVKSSVSKPVKVLMHSINVIITIACLIGFLNVLYFERYFIFKCTDQIWLIYVFSIFFVSLFYGFAKIRNLETTRERLPVFVFLSIYTIVYLFHFYYAYYFVASKLSNYYVTPLRWLLINLIPVIGLRWFTREYFGLDTGLEMATPGIDKFSDEYKLSGREKQVLKLLYDGKKNKEIAETLFISEQTVKNHLHNIYKKTGIKNRISLMKSLMEDNNKAT